MGHYTVHMGQEVPTLTPQALSPLKDAKRLGITGADGANGQTHPSHALGKRCSTLGLLTTQQVMCMLQPPSHRHALHVCTAKNQMQFQEEKEMEEPFFIEVENGENAHNKMPQSLSQEILVPQVA